MARLVFVQKDVFAKPGIMALSASVKRRGHSCALVVADLETDPVAAVIACSPDVIAFSITSGEYPFMKNMADRLRPYFTGRIICGGVHPTFYPEVLHDDNLDAICRGEGDDALPEYLDVLDNGGDERRVLNMSVKIDGRIVENPLRPVIDNLDRLPFVDRELYPASYDLYKKPGRDLLYHQVVMTGRGCPQTCSFCFNERYNALYRGRGAVVRRRSVDSIIREINDLTAQGTVRFITFDDDSFTLAPRAWLDDFCATYGREIGLPFKINSTPGALTEQRVKALKNAGCHAVKIGLESGNQAVRTTLLKKKVSDQSLITAAFLLKKHAIRFQTFNMVGLPGETLNQALETYALNRRLRPDFLWCSLLNPYPGTAIHRQCVRQGALKTTDDFSAATYSYFTRSPLAIPESVIRLQKLMYLAMLLRLSPETVRRLALLPLTRLYRFLFGIGMVLGLTRINKTSVISTLLLSWRYLARYNHED